MRRSLAILAATAALLSLPAAAHADFGLKELDATFTRADGSIQSQAGSHPFAFTTSLGVNTFTTAGGEVPEGEVRDLDVLQMPGLVGSQTAVPTCSSAQFNERVEGRAQCPNATAVGIVAVKGEFDVLPAGYEEFVHAPVYNLEPSPGEAAKLGFVILNVPIVVDVTVNPNPPYNLVAHIADLPQSLLFYGSEFTIWGNPASPLHNSLRGSCVGDPVSPSKEPISLGSCPVDVPEAPFLTLPRACTGPLATLFSADSWQGDVAEPRAALTHTGGEPPSPLGMTGCSELRFAPSVEARPSTTKAESPAGLQVTVQVKDEGLTSPTGIAQSDIRKVELTLPEGIAANPASAEGLAACGEGEYAAASLTVPGCPDASKLGALEVTTPLLKEGLSGSIYLASPRQNPFGTLIALYMVIRDQKNGILVKLPVKVEPDPKTGRLVSTVEDLPQLPFSKFTLRFREGPRAPLTTPPSCGTYSAKAIFTPWSGSASIPASADFEVNGGPNGTPCPPPGTPPFNPGFEAGSLDNTAGAFSPFYMRLTRTDGEQEMTRFDSILPPGVTGRIAGLGQCSDTALAAAKMKNGSGELASPSCPSGSQIGRVMVGAGVGPALTWVPGQIYLAGPFAGDPLSIAVITPAVAGPFDLGVVVTREALNLNPTTAEVEVDGAASDPIPHMLEGVPLKIRDLRVYVDRPGFTLNATSCEPEQTRATLFGSGADLFSSTDDFPAHLHARYQDANCENLGFGPRLALRMSGGTARLGHPALRAVLTPRRGDANVGRAQVTLPKVVFIDQGHIDSPCTRVQFAVHKCPPGSVLGIARAFTPLLDQPLEGPVYFRSNGGERKLPDLVADLHGQFHIELVGFIDSKHQRVRTTFAAPPDAPVSKFVLKLRGGKRGLLINSEDLCRRHRRALVKLTGQNGKLSKFEPAISNDCAKKKHAKPERRP